MANRRYIPKFQEGGYFGGEAMEGEAGFDIRKLAKAMKVKKDAFQKGHAKRGKWRGISDLIETGLGFIPGIGQALKSGLNVLSEQAIQHHIPVEGGPDLEGLETMWTAGEAKAGQEEWDKRYEASDMSLMDSLIGEAAGFAGTEAGGEFMGNLFSKAPVGGGSDIPKDYPIDWREGGRVPKYQEGGLTPEIINQLIKKRYGTTGFDEVQGMMALDRKFGDPGEFRIRPSEISRMVGRNPEARQNWGEQLEAIEERKSSESGFSGLMGKLFGGNKREYAGGGMVQSGAPSIANYFSMQGKSLGGSDKQSLAEKLGRI